jgi:hypothetical protein
MARELVQWDWVQADPKLAVSVGSVVAAAAAAAAAVAVADAVAVEAGLGRERRTGRKD